MVNSVPEGPGNDSYNDSDTEFNNQSHKLLCGSNVLKSAHGSDNKVTLYSHQGIRIILNLKTIPHTLGCPLSFSM